MNISEQQKHFESLVVRSRDILFKKGNDYANTDRLSNFKLAGTICGLNAEMNCLSLIATKTARLGVLLNSGKEPDNEGVRDSIIDLINYGILLDMIITDKFSDKFSDKIQQLADWDADGISHITPFTKAQIEP